MHITPIADRRAHVEAEDCWCDPSVEVSNGARIVAHHAADGREVRECVTGEAIRGKPWLCVQDGVPIENDPWTD